MALRAFYEQVNNFGVLDRLEIHEDGFSGDAIRLNSKGVNERFRFEHQEITQEGAGGVLNIHNNKIMMGMMEFYPYIDSADKKELLQDIADSQPFDFKLIWKKDSDVVWQGYPSGRVINNPERNNYFAQIQFKDFEILKRIRYPFTNERQTLITTISELLGYLEFDEDITTVTSWQEKNSTLSDDFLNQIYSDTVGLRNYGSTGDDSATQISVYDALLRLAEPCLLIHQWKGFRVDQISGYATPTAVLQSVYNSSGVQQTSGTVNATYAGYKKKEDGLPVVKVDSDNQSYPSIGEARVFFNFRTSESGIQVPSQIDLEESTAETGTISVTSGGTGVGGSGTSFLSVLSVGDEIWVPQSGQLELLGRVATIISNTTLTLESGANFSVSGSAWHINAKETATFTQDFLSSGNQRLRISPKVRLTGTLGTLSYFGRYSLRVGDVSYNSSTQTWDSSLVINEIATSGTNTLRTGGGNEETPDIPAGESGIELRFYLAVDEFGSSANIDTHLYEDTIFAIRDNTASNNSNGAEFSLTQDGGFEDYDFDTDFYGDGVVGALYLPANYRHSTNTIDVTDSWRRRGEDPYVGFHRLKLREVLDFQRLRIRKIYADVHGEIDPNKILVYDSQNFKYVGGSYDGFWSPRFMRVNEQLGDDDYLARLVFGTGVTSNGSTGGVSGGGITQGTADARYYRQSQLLSETPSGDLPTLINNIGLGRNLTANAGLTFSGGSSEVFDTSTQVWNTSDEIWFSEQSFYDGTQAALMEVDVDDVTIENEPNIRVKDGGISNSKLADDSVTTSKILDENVTNVKLANSTISGKQLGTNLDSLSTGTGMTGDAYNGSASRTFATVPASPSQVGHVTTGAQEFGGAKTFKGNLTYEGLIESDNFADDDDFYTGAQLSQDTLKIELIRANELRVKAFVAEISAALYGEDVLTKSRGVLSRDFTIPAVSSSAKLFVEDLEGFVGTPVFEDTDFVRMRVVDRSVGLQVFDVWGNVSGYTDEGDGEQSWDFTRIAGGSATTGDTVFTGSIAIDFGQSGDGVIIRSVIGDNTPRDSVLIWETSPISAGNYTLLTRTGNLNGSFGVTTDRYGFGAKDNVIIEVGDSNTMTLGKDAGGSGLHGIHINSENRWYGNGQLEVGGVEGLRFFPSQTWDTSTEVWDSSSAFFDAPLQVGTDALFSGNLGANTVTTNSIQSGAITADKIEASSITADKIDVDNLYSIDVNLTGNIGLTTGSIRFGDVTDVLSPPRLSSDGLIFASDTVFPSTKVSEDGFETETGSITDLTRFSVFNQIKGTYFDGSTTETFYELDKNKLDVDVANDITLGFNGSSVVLTSASSTGTTSNTEFGFIQVSINGQTRRIKTFIPT